MSGEWRVAVDARSLLCAQPRGEGKSLLRLYDEMCGLQPRLRPVFFGDARAAQFRGALPAAVNCRHSALFGDRWNLWEDLYFPLAARAAGCQLMHCTSSGAPRWAGMPMLMTVHDLIPLLFDDGQDDASRQLFRARLERGLRQAHTTLAVSDHTRHDLTTLFPYAQERVHTVHWGMDPRRPAEGQQSTRKPLVLAFGGEARRKNTAFTLERFCAAAERVPDLRLAMVGINSARLRAELEPRIVGAGLQSRVELLGFVGEDRLETLYRQASVLLYLSLYEGYGVPVAEALSRGVPVIASDRTSIAELLAGAQGAFSLDDPKAIEDAIVRATAPGDEAAASLAESQAHLPARFTWAACAQATLHCIQATAALT